MKIVTLISFIFFVLSASASLILEKHGIIFNYDHKSYKLRQPSTFGTQGVLALITDKKTGLKNFSLSSAGFVASLTRFEKECSKVHQVYKDMGGTLSPLKKDLKSPFPKCRFNRDGQASFDMIEITYNKKKRRAFIFSGVLLKARKNEINVYQREFKKLAKEIAYNL